MAWSNTIDPTKPADNDPASEGDNQIRALKVALAERLATRFPGWPTTQPMRVLAADVGTLAARPETPEGDGQLYVAITPAPTKLYYGSGGAWVQLDIGAGGSVSVVGAPSGQTFNNLSSCTDDVPTYLYRVSWVDNPAQTDATTRITVNGVQVGSVAFDVEEFDLTDLTAGLYIVGLEHVLEGVRSDMIFRVLEVINPCTGEGGEPEPEPTPALASFTLVNASYCTEDVPTYRVQLNYTRTTVGAQVRVKKEGVQVLLLSAASSSPVYFVIASGGEATHTFEASQIIGGEEGPSITKQITLENPCEVPALLPPGNLNIEEQGECDGVTSENAAMVSWVVSDATSKIRVYRQLISSGLPGSLLVELAAETLSFLDTTVVTDETYNYWLTHYDEGEDIESSTTGSLHYEAADICESLPDL